MQLHPVFCDTNICVSVGGFRDALAPHTALGGGRCSFVLVVVRVGVMPEENMYNMDSADD